MRWACLARPRIKRGSFGKTMYDLNLQFAPKKGCLKDLSGCVSVTPSSTSLEEMSIT